MHTKRLAAATAAALLAAGVAACGGSSDSGGAGSGGGPAATGGDAPAKRGGKVTVLAAGDVDYVDPGQSYYVFGLMVSTAVNRQLYTYKPGDDQRPTPDLATGQPQISRDGRTVTVKLRSGVRYAPPVDREVRAADVKYAMERAFSANVPNGYALAYFKDIVGAPQSPGAIRPIPGIRTPDDHTIVFRLAKPSAPLVSQALAMPITVPVPKEYAAKFDRKTPTDYDQYVAFTGPYMIRNDSQTGKLVGRRPGRQIQLVRNPNWDPKTDYRPAYLDAVDIDEGNSDTTVSSRRVLEDSGLIQGDGAPPAPVIKQAVQRYKDQIVFVPAGSNRYISLNTTIEPFDDIDVRKAVIAAFDRRAMQLTRGGQTAGDIATHYLPPQFPGFEEAGGMKGPGVDFLRNPNGDMKLAAEYMRKAGYPSGKYTGDEKLLMVATNADPGKKSAEVAAAQFEKLGFHLNFRTAPQDTLYTKFCNVPKAKVVICPNVGFAKDFLDPQSMLDPTFNGRNILPANNSNWSQFDDPEVNAKMEAAAKIAPGPERNKAWGEIDRLITEKAAAVPWFWDKQPLIASKDVRAVANAYQTTWDLSFTSLK
ncbi:MAG TPA: ABC transporter substrate-binding protein [Solirubrobacteraceae bacterium]|nr:ABC transporter substrate-binding protein [Solirubrobacteraceae bacterium]